MISYVLGFPFSADGKRVTLIRKRRPDWQRGRLNGIGGKVEVGDVSTHEAMRREALEEAGIERCDWEHVATMYGKGWFMDCFASFSDAYRKLTARTDEQLEVIYTRGVLVNDSVMPNLRVLIPLALDRSGIVKPVTLYDGVPQ